MRTKKRKWLRWVVGVVVAYLLAVTAANSMYRNQEPFLAEAPIGTNGFRVRLLKMSDGPLKYDWNDPRPQILQVITPKLIRKPQSFALVNLDGKCRKFIARPDQCEADTFLFRTVDSSGEYARDPGLSHLAFDLVESNGFVFTQSLFELEPWTWSAGGIERSALPRRDTALRIRVTDRNGKAEPVELQVANPFYRQDIQEWSGERLPIVRRNGGTTVVLDDIQIVGGRQLRPVFEIFGHDWHVSQMEHWFEDATGNQGNWLSPFEPAWKIGVKMVPFGFSGVPQENIWRLPVEPMTVGDEKKLDFAFELEGRPFKIEKIVCLPLLGSHQTSRYWIEQREKEAQKVLDSYPDGDIPVEKRRMVDPPAPPMAREIPLDRIQLHFEESGGGPRVPTVARLVNPDGTTSRGWMSLVSGSSLKKRCATFDQPEQAGPIVIELGVGRIQSLEFVVEPPAELKTEMMAAARQSELERAERKQQQSQQPSSGGPPAPGANPMRAMPGTRP